MNRQHRTRGHGVRATTEGDAHFVTLQPITPHVVDDYGSVWMPDVFDESLAQRFPTLTWSHSWSEPIGRAVDFTLDKTKGPTVRFRFDDFDAVPTARRAFAQVDSGTIDDCSVGFSNINWRTPTDAEVKKWAGCCEIMEGADLDECALVLRGAVPGAKVLALRSAGGTAQVDAELVIELARRVNSGEITEAEAKVAIDLAAGDVTEIGEPPPVKEDLPKIEDLDAVFAEADAVLEGRSR